MITLIIGPMYSGKTSELLRRLERFHIAKKQVILLRPKIDSRHFLSHSKYNVNWLDQKFVDLEDFDATKFSTIGIDEGQFFSNLCDFCISNSMSGKNIIISALHATSESNMFDSIINIIPHCDEIIKLNAVCINCGSDNGNYTYCLKEKIEEISIGGKDKYVALCRNCYYSKQKLKEDKNE